MKTLKFFMIMFLTIGINISTNAQTDKNSATDLTKTESFKVFGNCGMCKSRIEKAAREEGAENASWDSKSKLLTISYIPSKTSTDKLQKKVAAAGHDTEKYKATDEVYNSLPGCCHYERVK